MRVLYFSLVIVIIDQLSKLKVKGISIPWLGLDIKGMRPGMSLNIIDNFFKITYIENPGMAFGIELGSKLLLSLFTIFATCLIVYFVYKNRNESYYTRLSLAFILGGAIGNLIDRVFYGLIYKTEPIFYGKVVDFLQINIPDIKIFGKTFYSWPIFNVADVAVTIGFIMIIIGYRKVFHKSEHDEVPINPVNTTNPVINENSEIVELTNNSSEIKETPEKQESLPTQSV